MVRARASVHRGLGGAGELGDQVVQLGVLEAGPDQGLRARSRAARGGARSPTGSAWAVPLSGVAARCRRQLCCRPPSRFHHDLSRACFLSRSLTLSVSLSLSRGAFSDVYARVRARMCVCKFACILSHQDILGHDVDDLRVLLRDKVALEKGQKRGSNKVKKGVKSATPVPLFSAATGPPPRRSDHTRASVSDPRGASPCSCSHISLRLGAQGLPGGTRGIASPESRTPRRNPRSRLGIEGLQAEAPRNQAEAPRNPACARLGPPSPRPHVSSRRPRSPRGALACLRPPRNQRGVRAPRSPCAEGGRGPGRARDGHTCEALRASEEGGGGGEGTGARARKGSATDGSRASRSMGVGGGGGGLARAGEGGRDGGRIRAEGREGGREGGRRGREGARTGK